MHLRTVWLLTQYDEARSAHLVPVLPQMYSAYIIHSSNQVRLVVLIHIMSMSPLHIKVTYASSDSRSSNPERLLTSLAVILQGSTTGSSSHGCLSFLLVTLPHLFSFVSSQTVRFFPSSFAAFSSIKLAAFKTLLLVLLEFAPSSTVFSSSLCVFICHVLLSCSSF